MKYLVDTGASVTVISKAHDDMTAGNLNPVDFEVVQANGDPMAGQNVTEITVGPLRVIHQIVVADIKDDAILEINFLAEHDCKLDLASQVLTIQDTTINMWNEGDEISCCRVLRKYDYTIPAQHAKLVIGLLHRPGNECPVNVLEGTEKFTDQYGLLVAKLLTYRKVKL